MKAAFYPRLAWDGLRRNRRMSWPYLLTCVCMVAVHYILGFLASPAAVQMTGNVIEHDGGMHLIG